MNKKLRVDVWSDVVCPWCAIGKKRLERALGQFAHGDSVEVAWHPFELDPGAPAIQEGDNVARLGRKYGRTRDQALAMMRNVEQTAARDGLELHLTTARTGNTFDAHRVLQLAEERGVENAVNARFFAGYMTEGLAIGDREVLVKLASEAGLDAAEVRDVLESGRFGDEVRELEEEARSLGIQGVPFFVFGSKYAVSGAQPPELLLGALEKAWSELGPEDLDDDAIAEGASCGPEGCA
jgi:predicted DsbA family dithiol-disulfide isomerase